MKKIIPFSKDIKFNTKIYEITSISLENTLTTEKTGEIDGEFIISGDYKMNDSSINTEPFIYGLPFNISINDYYEMDTIKIDIDDFKYEIINEEILRVNIDVLLEGKVKVEQEEKQEEINPDVIIEARKDKDEIIDEYIGLEVEKMDIKEEKDLFKEESEVKEVSNEITSDKKATSIFENFSNNDEKYISYFVHIVRENDTLETISMKYNVSIDDIKQYNDIENTIPGKLIIPFSNDKAI